MNGLKTMFDQVPIEVARRASAPRNGLVFCAVCRNTVALETCQTDEHGHAVHLKCYFARLTKPGDKRAAKARSKKKP
jgi:hypothetical protein